MDVDRFRKRLTELRLQKKVTARGMSLSLGKSGNYITDLESGKSLPSLTAFLDICDFFEISPAQFFQDEEESFERTLLYTEIMEMDELKLDVIKAVVDALKKI